MRQWICNNFILLLYIYIPRDLHPLQFPGGFLLLSIYTESYLNNSLNRVMAPFFSSFFSSFFLLSSFSSSTSIGLVCNANWTTSICLLSLETKDVGSKSDPSYSSSILSISDCISPGKSLVSSSNSLVPFFRSLEPFSNSPVPFASSLIPLFIFL